MKNDIVEEEKPKINMYLNKDRYIFWLDKNIKNAQNQKYLKILEKEFPKPKYTISTFDSVKSTISYLENKKEDYDFTFIYFIVSGRKAEKFFNKYNLLTKTTIIAATIVFCANKKLHSSKPYANDLYLNPGGVVTHIKEVIDYIKSSNDKLWNNLTNLKENDFALPEEKNTFGDTFKYANNLSDITLPIILIEIIKKNLISDIDIINFKKFIFAKYPEKKEIIKLVKPSLEKNVYIPLKKRAKFLLRLYTLNTDFYRNLDKYLTNYDGFGFYKVFILILFNSIQSKNFKSYVKGKLYRRALMSNSEMNEIIRLFEIKKQDINNKNEISSILYYSKPFLSFTKDKSQIYKFANIIQPNTVRITFIINPPKHKDKIYYSNIDIDELKLSRYKTEKEVLFLPLSCFEIEKYVKTGDFDYEITLNYLDKYYSQLENKINIMKEEKEMQDFYEKVLESSFSERVIECLKDYDTIFTNIKDFFLDHSSIPEINLNYNKLIPKLPHDKLVPRFSEKCSMEGLPSGFSNGKQLNALFSSEPVSIQLQQSKSAGYKIWELKYSDGSKAIIRQHPKKGTNIIIKQYDENGNLGYYDEAYKPISKEIKIDNTNTQEVLVNSKDFNMNKIKELSILRSGFASANLFGGAIGYNLANIDNFVKSSGADKAKTLGATFGISTGMFVLSNAAKVAVPFVSGGLLGGFYIFDLTSDIINHALTKKETAISILKNTTNLAVNIGTGLGGFYAGLQIGVSLGITTGPGVILIGLGSGVVGGLLGGLFGRIITSTKMTLNCNSFYKNYIPLKFREEGNIPDLFWNDVNKKTKSLALEVIIDQKYKTWSVINIPPKTRRIKEGIGETLIKYENFRHLNPNKVDFLLYSLNKENITKEEWNDQTLNKKLIIDVAILEVDNL